MTAVMGDKGARSLSIGLARVRNAALYLAAFGFVGFVLFPLHDDHDLAKDRPGNLRLAAGMGLRPHF
jgi:hypothetical protein